LRPTVCLPISGGVLWTTARTVGAFWRPTVYLPILGAVLLILVGAVDLRLGIALGATFCRAGVLQSGIRPAYGAENQHTDQTCKCYS